MSQPIPLPYLPIQPRSLNINILSPFKIDTSDRRRLSTLRLDVSGAGRP